VHPDLARLEGALRATQAEVHRLADGVDDAIWGARPADNAWSMGECVAHLTLTNTAFFDLIDSAVERARALGRVAPHRLRRDLVGWLLSRGLEPPVRARLKTTAPFAPKDGLSRAQTLPPYDRSQAALLERLHRMDGLDVTGVKVTSPFNARMRYSLYSVFCITAAHQRRHLWQMARAGEALQHAARPRVAT
jgi:hypothetical protein